MKEDPENKNDRTPREILSQFYSDNNLPPDGGQSSPSVKIELSPRFHFYFPNFNARRKAVIKHDIHHLLTGYDTSITGESEISAWEIASRCKKYWAAFVIDISGVILGVLVNFRGVLRAFARGRRTKNLYHDSFSTEQALDMKIKDLRSYLELDRYPMDVRPSLSDTILFLLFILFGSIYSIISLILFPFVIFYTIHVLLNGKNK